METIDLIDIDVCGSDYMLHFSNGKALLIKKMALFALLTVAEKKDIGYE
jgi:hypothetical protein